MQGLKIRYKGKTPVDTIKLNHRLFGCLHKRKANCVSYTPGFLHNITYTKIYNSCYFLPIEVEKYIEKVEELKNSITEKIGEFCMDLDMQEFELKEDEFFQKYKFKNAYEYWRDYAKDLERVFKCRAKYRLDLIQETKTL